MSVRFEDGELVDGTIDGWPCSFMATFYRGQGWSLNVAPYSGEGDEPAPQGVQEKCWKANDADVIDKASVRRVLAQIGFQPEEA
jgi:hypothetical protein